MENARIELTLKLERATLHRRHVLEQARQLEEEAELLRRHLRELDRALATPRSNERHPVAANNNLPLSLVAADGRRVLRRRDLQAAVGLSASSIYRLIGLGQFPQPIHLGERAVGWLRSDIEGWLSQRHKK